MATNVPGVGARIFPWQMRHYIQRGGPNDPTAQAAYSTHWGGTSGSPLASGILSWNSVVSYGAVPGPLSPPTQALPRTMSPNSTGTLTATTGTLATNTGGILIGTIPGGAWIDNVSIFCLEAMSGGTSTSFGLFYAPANTFSTTNTAGLQPATLYVLGYITAPVAGTEYGAYAAPAANAVTTVGCLRSVLTGYQVGPGIPAAYQAAITGGPASASQTLCSAGPPEGEGFAGMAQAQASGGAVPTPAQGDIDVYAVMFLVAGAGTAPTQGSFECLVDFTGHEG